MVKKSAQISHLRALSVPVHGSWAKSQALITRDLCNVLDVCQLNACSAIEDGYLKPFEILEPYRQIEMLNRRRSSAITISFHDKTSWTYRYNSPMPTTQSALLVQANWTLHRRSSSALSPADSLIHFQFFKLDNYLNCSFILSIFETQPKVCITERNIFVEVSSSSSENETILEFSNFWATKSFSQFARAFNGTTIDPQRSACEVHSTCTPGHTAACAARIRTKPYKWLNKQQSKFKTNKMFEANHVM